jgi:hypothetical protein
MRRQASNLADLTGWSEQEIAARQAAHSGAK